MPRDTINTNQARPMAATLALGKALGAMCPIPGMSPRYAAASASHNLRSSPSRLAVSERQSRTQCSRVRRCQKCVFPGTCNAWRSAESRRDSADSTSRALDSLCQRNLDTPDVTVDGHAVGLSGSFAGPCSTAPVHRSNREPCHGHVTVESPHSRACRRLLIRGSIAPL
jgi:hypothetical protein